MRKKSAVVILLSDDETEEECCPSSQHTDDYVHKRLQYEAIPPVTDSVAATTVQLNKQFDQRSKWYCPIPLFLEDVLKIKHSGKNCHLYELSFTEVAFYGHAVALIGKYTSTKNLWKYRVDDGTASVMVHYAHGCQSNMDLLRSQSDIRHSPLLKSLNLMPPPPLRTCERKFRHGSKVMVIGRPYHDSYNGTVGIWANRMFEDSGRSRALELKFKANLERMYCNVYHK